MSSRLGGGGRQSLYFASKKSGDDVTALAWLYLVVLVVDIVTHLRVRRFVVLQAADSNALSVSQILRNRGGGEVSKSAKVFKKQKLCCAPPPLHDSLSHPLSKLPSQPSWRLLLIPMYFSPFPLLLSCFTFLPPFSSFPLFSRVSLCRSKGGELGDSLLHRRKGRGGRGRAPPGAMGLDRNNSRSPLGFGRSQPVPPKSQVACALGGPENSQKSARG